VAMPSDCPPDLEALADCGALVATAVHQSEPERTQAIAFFDEILHGERICGAMWWKA
jgi:hypothetical protein